MNDGLVVANCVGDYSAEVVYFPPKARVEFATQFEIGYHRHRHWHHSITVC